MYVTKWYWWVCLAVSHRRAIRWCTQELATAGSPREPQVSWLPAGDNAKIWVVAGESVSRVGNYPIQHVGTGRTFSYDGDGHLYLNHSTGSNYLKIDTSSETGNTSAGLSFSTASYTYAVVVDLVFQTQV